MLHEQPSLRSRCRVWQWHDLPATVLFGSTETIVLRDHSEPRELRYPQTSVRDCFTAVLIADGSEAMIVGMSTQASAAAFSLLYSSVGGGVLLSIPVPSAS